MVCGSITTTKISQDTLLDFTGTGYQVGTEDQPQNCEEGAGRCDGFSVRICKTVYSPFDVLKIFPQKEWVLQEECSGVRGCEYWPELGFDVAGNSELINKLSPEQRIQLMKMDRVAFCDPCLDFSKCGDERNGDPGNVYGCVGTPLGIKWKLLQKCTLSMYMDFCHDIEKTSTCASHIYMGGDHPGSTHPGSMRAYCGPPCGKKIIPDPKRPGCNRVTEEKHETSSVKCSTDLVAPNN